MNLSLKLKMLLGFGLCILLTVAMGAGSIAAAFRLSQHTTQVSEQLVPAMQSARGMQANLFEMQMQRLYYLQATDDDQAQAYEKRIGEIAAAFKADRDTFGRHSPDSEALAAFDQRMATFLGVHQAVINLVKMGNPNAAASRLRDESGPVLKDLFGQLTAWGEASASAASAEAASAAATRERLVALLAVGLVVAVLTGAAVSLLITRGVMRQLGGDPRYAFDVVTQIVGGNLAVRIETAPGDSSSLLYAMKGMAAALADMVRDVQASARSIQASTTEVASGNRAFASRTEQQANALVSTASLMEQLDTIARQSAQGVLTANELAGGASSVASQGGEVVSRVVDTMKDINDSSKHIADITGVIDGIAFQTNILALNAAVEAARAGEQGRGFAVVATEVRSLAQRSADAAKQIKSLIGASVARVETGTSLVDQAGGTMGAVVAAIQRVTAVMGDISRASTEQSSGVSSVSAAVMEMEASLQQNAALAEQCDAAAASLSHQVQNLINAVAAFQLPDHAASEPALTA